ncbi:MAG: sulfite exporter TauE/SafE family protein [Bacteroidia bacterium]
MEIIGYIASILIGISLGLIGGGGSILAVPILVYLFKINPENATSYSLFIVGVTSLFGAVRHYKMGNLQLQSALIFAIPSVLSLLVVRKLILPLIPAHLFWLGSIDVTKNMFIMIVFAGLMIAASTAMIRTTPTVNTGQKSNLAQLGGIGFLVGLITGFLGAGGGFLIIPALLFFANLSMKQAVGTSLLIIFINSLIGFAGDVFNGITLNFQLLFLVTSIALIGMLIGTVLSKKIDGTKLKPAFGWFVLLMGIYIVAKELFF